MAMVDVSDNIGGGGFGGWGGGSNGMWILLLAFLFMFRGGFGGEHRGGHDGGYGENYKRYDADFDYLKRDNWDLQKEGLVRGYQAEIAQLKCCLVA